MKVQLGVKPAAASSADPAHRASPPDAQTLLPPGRRPRRRALLGGWQAVLQASTLFVSLVSLTMSSVVFMVLLYTPASGPLGQGHAISELHAVSDLQRQVIIRLQRQTSYLEARQKIVQSVLENAALLTENDRDKLQGIENALQAKISGGGIVLAVPDSELQESAFESGAPVGRPDGHDFHQWGLLGRSASPQQQPNDPAHRTLTNKDTAQDSNGSPDSHEVPSKKLIGRPDGHDSWVWRLIGRQGGDAAALTGQSASSEEIATSSSEESGEKVYMA